MDTNKLIGLVFALAGIVDVFVAYAILAPKIEDERTRTVVVLSVSGTGVAMAAAGVALLAGWFSLV